VPANLLKSVADALLERKPREALLTYASQHVVFRREPWVLELELVHALGGGAYWAFGWYKRIIECALASDYCKRIIVWTEAARQTILNALNSTAFSHKLEIVRLARRSNTGFVKTVNRSAQVKLLFVNSINIPDQFYLKGGGEAIEAFRLLREEYSNLHLVLRSDVPAEVRAQARQIPGLRIVDRPLAWEDLQREFQTADIYLFPSHITPGMSVLDAMSYELPVVTVDAYANAELVENAVTGFVVPASKRVPYADYYFRPSAAHDRRFSRAIRMSDPQVVQALVERLRLLIEHSDLRRQMGRAGRNEVDHGRFSIERRNKKLNQIFDEAIGAHS
jgi:glycosyltransferase involved in cell wall biosynthesis